MIITKKVLKKFMGKCQDLVDQIDEVADECTAADDHKEGETELAEALWSAQMEIENAKLTLEEWV